MKYEALIAVVAALETERSIHAAEFEYDVRVPRWRVEPTVTIRR